MVQKEILQARKIPRNELLDREKSERNDGKLTFNVTYYPAFGHLKCQLNKLACDEAHQNVFPEV